jgi:fatty-acyl-CoA synthase
MMMRNRPEFVQMAAAVSRMGGAAVSVSWRSTPSELVYLASHCGAKGIAFEHDLWHVVEQAKKELPNIAMENLFAVGGPVKGTTPFESLLDDRSAFVPEKGAAEDAAVVIYTSGTTGKPKGAVRKFPKDALPAAMRFMAETPMRVDDIHLTPCPLYHSTAFGFLTLSHILGASVVLMDEFKPEPFLQHVERYGVTSTAVVPTMLHRVLALGDDILEKYDTRSLRCIFSGGAPLPGPLAIEVMDHFGDVLYNFYGATETGLVTLGKPVDLRASPGTIGRAVPGNEIRLLDDDGNEVKPGGVGELYVRNKMLVAGYHKDNEATKSSMREGFFSVGDLARQDRDGRYFIEGRKRDMVISGGVNVYPAEVEGVLETHLAIAEVAVVGVEDPEWGERVRAFIAPKPGVTLDEGELKLWVRERLAGPKVPRDFIFVDALPRNPTGKVLKRELREWRKAQ